MFDRRKAYSWVFSVCLTLLTVAVLPLRAQADPTHHDLSGFYSWSELPSTAFVSTTNDPHEVNGEIYLSGSRPYALRENEQVDGPHTTFSSLSIQYRQSPDDPWGSASGTYVVDHSPTLNSGSNKTTCPYQIHFLVAGQFKLVDNVSMQYWEPMGDLSNATDEWSPSSGNSYKTVEDTIRVVASNMRLSADVDFAKAGKPVKLTASLESPDASTTVTFHDGPDDTSGFDTESASSGSVTITLPNDQHSSWPGNNAGSHRFWITTNEPTKFPVPAGGDGQPNDPNDSSDGPKANETDVTWATVNLGVDYGDDGTIDLPEETKPAPNEEDPGAYTLLNSGLVPVIVDYAPSGTDNATLTLKVIQSGKGNVKVWKDVNKTNAITLPKTWNLKTDTVPGKIYVEGVAASSSTKDTTLELAYSKVSGQNVKDDVKWTIVKGDLTAYRPQQSGGSYAPFSKTAVSDADEMKSDLGPGIRIDNPGDNDPNGEDDCIELKITDPTQNAKVVLERSSSDLKVWQSSDETGAITFTNNKSSPLGPVPQVSR